MRLRRPHRLAAAAILTLAALLVACGSGAAGGATPPSGLYGVVTRGPTTPVCRVSTPCSKPAQVTLAFTRPGHDPVRVRSRATGAYRVALPPGTYAVRVAIRGPGGSLRPARATVVRGRFVRVNFQLDTGIR